MFFFLKEVTLWHKGYYDSMCKLGLWLDVEKEIETRIEPAVSWDLPYADSVIGGWLTSAMHLGKSFPPNTNLN